MECVWNISYTVWEKSRFFLFLSLKLLWPEDQSHKIWKLLKEILYLLTREVKNRQFPYFRFFGKQHNLERHQNVYTEMFDYLYLYFSLSLSISLFLSLFPFNKVSWLLLFKQRAATCECCLFYKMFNCWLFHSSHSYFRFLENFMLVLLLKNFHSVVFVFVAFIYCCRKFLLTLKKSCEIGGVSHILYTKRANATLILP